MREEYDFSNAIKNPYAKALKKQDTVELSPSTAAYFHARADQMKMSYQTLVNLYLEACLKEEKEPELLVK